MKSQTRHVQDGGSGTTSTLALLLNPEQVADLLREEQVLPSKLLNDLTSVRIVRYSPRGSDGLTVEWSLTTKHGERHSLFATWNDETEKEVSTAGFPPDSAPTPEKPSALTRAPGEDPSTTGYASVGNCVASVFGHLHDRDVTIHSPERDRRLPQLAACLDSDAMSSRLTDLIDPAARNGRGSERIVTSSLLGYRPGRRAAIHYSVDFGNTHRHDFVGKTFHDLRGRRLVDVHRQVCPAIRDASDGCVAISQAVGFFPELKMALFQWSAGVDAGDAMLPIDRQLLAAATAAAAIHSLTDDALPRFELAHECAILRRWYEFLHRVDPGRAARAQPLLSDLLRAADGLPVVDPVPVHRDFYEKQLLVADDIVTVLDLDTLALGDPCVDLGNFLAHQQLRLLREGKNPSSVERCWATFLGRYEARRHSVNRTSLAFYFASSLFRLGAVHAFRSGSGRFAETLWRVGGEHLAARMSQCDPRTRAGGGGGHSGPTQRATEP